MRFLATAISVLLFCSSASSQRSAKAGRTPQSEFTALIKRYYEAWNSHDTSKAGELYAKDAGNVFYDIAPLKYNGWAEYEEGVKKNFFDMITAGTLTPKDDLKVTQRGNVAWTTVTFHLSVTFKSGGGPLEADCRHTAIWERSNGKWRIVHEHVSAPLN